MVTKIVIVMIIVSSFLFHFGNGNNKNEQQQHHNIPYLMSGRNLPLNYQPNSKISDYASIDMDQHDIEQAVMQHTEAGFQTAMKIYTEGAHSMSYANLTILTPILRTIPKGTPIQGISSNGQPVFGTIQRNVYYGSSSTTNILFLYDTTNTMDGGGGSPHVMCQVGASIEPLLEGCLNSTGVLTFIIGDDNQVLPQSYIYDPYIDNHCGRKFIQFSQNAKETMYECNNGGANNCPYTDYMKFYTYYNQFDYANEWITSALLGRTTNFPNGGDRNNQVDFRTLSMYGRAEAVKVGTAFMSLWMYTIRSMEFAIDTCIGECSDHDYDCYKHQVVRKWDQAVAYYTGSYAASRKNGYLLYSLADEMCENFGTCSLHNDNAFMGTSYVNIKIFEHYNTGQYLLSIGNCTQAKYHKDRIVQLMTIPLIQSTIHLAHRKEMMIEHSSITMREAENGRGMTFAASIIPILYNCSTSDAEIVHNAMFNNNNNNNEQQQQKKQKDLLSNSYSSTNFQQVLKAFERNYQCMGITCEQIGGLVEKDFGISYEVFPPCSSNYQQYHNNNNLDGGVNGQSDNFSISSIHHNDISDDDDNDNKSYSKNNILFLFGLIFGFLMGIYFNVCWKSLVVKRCYCCCHKSTFQITRWIKKHNNQDFSINPTTSLDGRQDDDDNNDDDIVSQSSTRTQSSRASAAVPPAELFAVSLEEDISERHIWV